MEQKLNQEHRCMYMLSTTITSRVYQLSIIHCVSSLSHSLSLARYSIWNQCPIFLWHIPCHTKWQWYPFSRWPQDPHPLDRTADPMNLTSFILFSPTGLSQDHAWCTAGVLVLLRVTKSTNGIANTFFITYCVLHSKKNIRYNKF